MTEPSRPGRVVIAGGSGFLGVALATHLAGSGTPVVLLSRSPPRAGGPWRHVRWDGRTLGEWRGELDGAAGLVNLTGRTVDCVKTPDHCDEILRSRVEATRVLGLAVRAVEAPPPVWVQMSTAHLYGDPPDVTCDEDSPFGYGLAPFVGRAWEEEFRVSVLPSQRAVVLRTSFVLGRDRGTGGGALTRLAMLARLGLGGTIGSGTQGMSWIHEADMNRLFERALTDPAVHGPYIASSPNPVPQRVFMRELAAPSACPSASRPSPGWSGSGRATCRAPTRNSRSTGGTWSRSGSGTSDSNSGSRSSAARSMTSWPAGIDKPPGVVREAGGWHAHVFVGMSGAGDHAHEDVGMPPRLLARFRSSANHAAAEDGEGRDPEEAQGQGRTAPGRRWRS